MFEKYFVTCPVAVALRGAGFDEPCMAAREHYMDGDEVVDILHICYFDSPTNIDLYIETIRELLKSRPGLLEDKRTNKQLPPWLYAAPLYGQVLEWFMSKGLYLHPYYAPKFDGKIAIEPKYGCNVLDKNLKHLWPEGGIFSNVVIIYPDRRAALEQAILVAIKLLSDVSKLDM